MYRLIVLLVGLIAAAPAWAACPTTPADCPPMTTNNPTIVGVVGGGATYTAPTINGGTLGGSITATGATITGGTFSGSTTPVTNVTDNYLTVSADRTVCVNDGASSPTITLGAGFAAGILQIVTDCGLHASAHNITIAPTSGTISGFTNVLFNQDGTSQAFRYTGTTWVMQ